MSQLHWESGHLLMQDGRLVHAEGCCCCECDNCCLSMETWYTYLLVDYSTDGCDSQIGAVANSFRIDDCGGGEASPCFFELECIEDRGNRRGFFRLWVHIESSAPCEFDATYEAEGDCWPPDVTFNLDTGANCCGAMTVRYYAPDCELTVCNCRCDNHCTNDDMVLTASNHSGCAGIGSDEVEVSCSGGCSWTGSGSFGGDCSTSYDFEVTGASDDNCEGDYTLTIRSGGTIIWQGTDNCNESLCYPTAIVFGPIELPCCDGGTIKITMSEPST